MKTWVRLLHRPWKPIMLTSIVCSLDGRWPKPRSGDGESLAVLELLGAQASLPNQRSPRRSVTGKFRDWRPLRRAMMMGRHCMPCIVDLSGPLFRIFGSCCTLSDEEEAVGQAQGIFEVPFVVLQCSCSCEFRVLRARAHRRSTTA